jgi:hypothetical protein
MLAIANTRELTEQLDYFIEWYAQDLQDASYTATFEMISYLRYGDTNKGLAEIRKNDALKFVKDFPRLVPVVYRFVKHSGLLEDRFWKLFKDDAERKERVKEEESALPWSSMNSPVKGPAAMFLEESLAFWTANPSGSRRLLGSKDSTDVSILGHAVALAVTTCSNPSASKDKCENAISSAEKLISNFSVAQFVLECSRGMPELKSWIGNRILKTV